MIRYADICAGISAPTAAWANLGWECAFHSEIDNFPRAVLSHHYPDTPLEGDFTKLQGDEHGPVDLIVGGTPCQSFSVAGLRGGLADDRGNLALEFLRLAERMSARWLLWENVPGVFSSLSHAAPGPCPPPPPLDLERDGAEMETEDEYDSEELHAFNCFLVGLSECGYGYAYRSLDAQHFGVPQRRRRVFVVGYLGDWRLAAAVLFERASLSGHPAPRRKTGEGLAGSLEASTGGSDENDAKDGRLIAACVTSRERKGPDSDATSTLIAHTLRAEGFDASEDGTGRGTPIVPVQCNGSNVGTALPALRAGMSVRRLTPTECERLQGFSDGYTQVPYRGKPAADGPRYQALGNSMAVPVVRWIGERIKAVMDLRRES